MSVQTPEAEITILRQPAAAGARRSLARFFRDPKAAVSAILIVGFILLAIAAPLFAPYGENQQNLLASLKAPSLHHLLGTDRIGRDVLSRVIYGTRTSMSVGLIAVGVACAIGVPLGLISGYAGRWTDEIAMRIVDAWIAFPSLILVLALLVILGPGIGSVMIAIGLGAFPIFARLVRAQTLSLKEQDFVLAARAVGASHARILRSHLLPNTLAPVIVQASLLVGFAVLTEAGLSFLGVGIKPPTASWGIVIQEGFPDVRSGPWTSLAPGVAITVFVLAVNLLGDRLRDVLDPHFRGAR